MYAPASAEFQFGNGAYRREPPPALSLRRGITMLALLVVFATLRLGPSTPPPHIEAIAIVVRDSARERRFYVSTLGFRPLGTSRAADARIEHLALGDERLDLVQYATSGAPIPVDARSDDRAFQHIAIIVSDIDRAWERVRRAPIRLVSPRPQLLPRSNLAAGGIAAVYFRDPEGHPLELLHFPPDKGAPQWHRTDRLFLGIDHSAIAVRNTAASTRFYEALGFAVRGRSDNVGREQERLSGIAHAHVRITGLRFAGAPGIEFLEYLTPARPQPRERAALRDAIATRTIVFEPRARDVCRRFAAASPHAGGCIVRDPDGHIVDVRAW
jgi:catechol 2,3-dioxygenase-like lactoylglutathione lyase family enzyme